MQELFRPVVQKTIALVIPSVLGLAILLFGQPAPAHHAAITLYDREGDIEITGEVTEVRWRNPHARLTVRVTEDGQAQDWMLEGADATSMQSRGVPPGLIEVGDTIRVGGFPSRRGRNDIWTTNILLEDGREILIYRVAPRWSDNTIGQSDQTETVAHGRNDASSGIFGVWFTEAGFDGDIDAGVWGGDIQLTPEGAIIRDQYDPSQGINPFISCTRGFPELMAGFGPLEFVDQGDRILFRFEEFDMVRHIMMGPDAEANRPPKSQVGAYGDVGYSVGHWEGGNTLEVRTTGMNFPYYDQSGLAQTADAEVVERWTLNDAGDELQFEMTIIDPATFVKPVVQTKIWYWAPDRHVEPYNCDYGQDLRQAASD